MPMRSENRNRCIVGVLMSFSEETLRRGGGEMERRRSRKREREKHSL